MVPIKRICYIVILSVLVLATALLPLFVFEAHKSQASEANAENPEKWFDYSDGGMPWDETCEIMLPEYPETIFHWDTMNLWAEEANENILLYWGMPIWSVYFCDLNGDGLRELCSEVSFGSGVVDQHIEVYDYAEKHLYTLWERMEYDYFLTVKDGALCAEKRRYGNWQEIYEGRLSLAEDETDQTQLIMSEE